MRFSKKSTKSGSNSKTTDDSSTDGKEYNVVEQMKDETEEKKEVVSSKRDYIRSFTRLKNLVVRVNYSGS